MIGPAPLTDCTVVGPLTLAVRRGDRFVHCRVTSADASDLSAEAFEKRSAAAYDLLAKQLRSFGLSPVRFWNYIPDIHRRDGTEGLDRYMVFNSGRFSACERWLGGAEQFETRLATASAVGHHDADLIVDVLADQVPGEAVENPRQVSAYKYSKQYGPRPPCFARATLIRGTGRPMLLAGGTASIRGELSMHLGDLPAQMDETFENLAALVRAGAERLAAPYNALAREAERSRLLAAYAHLRIYHPVPGDAPEIGRRVAREMPALRGVELLPAGLCRSELLVEIEGIATFDGN